MPLIPSAARELAELRSRIWWRDVRLSKSQGTLIPRYEVHSIYCKIKDGGGDKKVSSMFNQQRLNFECHSMCKEEPLVCSNYGHLVNFFMYYLLVWLSFEAPILKTCVPAARGDAQQGVYNKGTTPAGLSPFSPFSHFSTCRNQNAFTRQI